MNEALLLAVAAVAFKSYNIINFIYVYMLRLQSLLRGRTFFYMTIDGEHEVAQNFLPQKKRRVVV